MNRRARPSKPTPTQFSKRRHVVAGHGLPRVLRRCTGPEPAKPGPWPPRLPCLDRAECDWLARGIRPPAEEARRRTPAVRPHSWTLAVTVCLGGLLCLGPAATVGTAPPDSVTPCLPCHNLPDSDPVGEWLASPYSQAEGGQVCQDCHRHPCSGTGDGTEDTGPPDAPSGSREEAARLTVTTTCSGDRLDAEVVVANLGAGHDLPTGPPQRLLLLEVTARSQDGLPLLRLRAGEIPMFADQPADAAVSADSFSSTDAAGRVFAETDPAGNSSIHRSRLAPFETDVSRYRFQSPGCKVARVTARLVLLPNSGGPSEIARTTALYQSRFDRPVSTADHDAVRSP